LLASNSAENAWWRAERHCRPNQNETHRCEPDG
jgi:hypothetical protein